MGTPVAASLLALPWSRFRASLGDLDKALFLFLLLATIAPVWCFRYFPSQDGPAHLENATILREYSWPDREIFRTYYTIDTNPNPNWAGHLILVGLMAVMPPLVAEKVLLTGYLILVPVCMRYALNAVRPGGGALALLAFPLTPNLFFHMGFYNFCYSLALFFLVVGYWLRHREHFGWRETTILSALGLVLYFCHLASLAAAWVVIGAMGLWQTHLDFRAARRPGHAGPRLPWGAFRLRFVPLIGAFVPSLLLTLWFLRHQGLGWKGDSDTNTVASLLKLETLVSYYREEGLVAAALSAALIGLFVYFVISRPSPWRPVPEDGLLLAAVAFVALYFLAPPALAGGMLLNYRMTLYAVFALILWFATRPISAAAQWVVRLVAIVSTIALVALHIHAYSRLNGYLEEYLCVAESIEPGTTLLPLSFSHAGQTPEGEDLSNRVGAFLHASGYIVADKPVVHLLNYEATTGYFPIQYRPELNPYALMGQDETVPDAGLHGQPPRIDFQRYPRPIDYVLVWNLTEHQRTDKRAAAVLRQLDAGGFKLVAKSSPRGLVLLYRRQDLKVDGDR
jgi:hypothetical protein